MFAVLVIFIWSIVLGLTAKRFAWRQDVLLIGGILIALVVQYVIFGPS